MNEYEDIENTEGMNWADAGLRPRLFGPFHVWLVAPILGAFFMWMNLWYWLFLGSCFAFDLFLFKRNLTLIALIKKARIWVAAGVRNRKDARWLQKTKQGRQYLK